MTSGVPHSLSRNEARLLLRFADNHFYFFHEVACGDKNDYKYLRSLAEKEWIETEKSASYLPLQSGTQLPELNLVRLTWRGSRLKEAIGALKLVERQNQTEHFSIKGNDFALLLSLSENNRPIETEHALTRSVNLSSASVNVSLSRLRDLGLVSKKSISISSDGYILALALKDQPSKHAATQRVNGSLPGALLDTSFRGRNLFDDVVQCRRALQVLVGLEVDSSREAVLILGDTTTHHIATLFAIACDMLNVEHTFIIMPPQAEMGRLPPLIAAAVEKANVLIGIARESISYSGVVRRRLQKEDERSFRCVDFYGPKLSWLSDFVMTDTDKLRQVQGESERVAEVISGWKQLRVTSRLGTDITFTRQSKIGVQLGRCFDMRVPDVKFPKQTANTTLLAGELFFETVKAQGVVVFDGPCNLFPGGGVIPFSLSVEDGMVVKIEGEDRYVGRIGEFIEEYPENRELSALCVGTNRFYRITGDYVPDCKVRGTINFVFGGNVFVRGRRDSAASMSSVIYSSELSDEDGPAKIVCDGRRFMISIL
jgi:leucyl aminopeptidase (aminopeptidase T)